MSNEMVTAEQRAAFEAWLTRNQSLRATWNEARNGYDEVPAHLAFKAWTEQAKRIAELEQQLASARKETTEIEGWYRAADAERIKWHREAHILQRGGQPPLLKEMRQLLATIRDEFFNTGKLTGRTQRAGEDMIMKLDSRLATETGGSRS